MTAELGRALAFSNWVIAAADTSRSRAKSTFFRPLLCLASVNCLGLKSTADVVNASSLTVGDLYPTPAQRWFFVG